MAALWRSDTAIKALQANATAWKTFTEQAVLSGKTVAILAGLNPSSYADMTAIAASSTAMAAIIATRRRSMRLSTLWRRNIGALSI